MQKSSYIGYIKDYEGATLMHVSIFFCRFVCITLLLAVVVKQRMHHETC